MFIDAENVEPRAFVEGMAEMVATLQELCSVIAEAPKRHGMMPSVPSAALADIAAEARFKKRFGDDWSSP
jgi:hypothetical protein